MKVRVGLLFFGLFAANVLGWVLLTAMSIPDPFFWSAGLLAYIFGLRHAFDADHIAAIDNTTRKLMHEGQKPIGIGFFFSLGHSTVVTLLSIAVVVSTRLLDQNVRAFHVMGIWGTVISSLFLLLIAVMNIAVMRDTVKHLRPNTKEPEPEITGVYTRIFGRMFRLIHRSWQMYFIGFLFGLGFDTATEVALLGMSVSASSHHLSAWAIMILPFMFAAGMTIIDSADGIAMIYAYRWAFKNPLRKIYYNLVITSLSVFVALTIGLVEMAQVLARVIPIRGPVAGWLEHVQLGIMGVAVVGLFALVWLVAWWVYRRKQTAAPGY